MNPAITPSCPRAQRLPEPRLRFGAREPHLPSPWRGLRDRRPALDEVTRPGDLLPFGRVANVLSSGSPALTPPSEDYDANGVDRTLIRACLQETPLECLQALEEMHQLAESVIAGGKQIPSAD